MLVHIYYKSEHNHFPLAFILAVSTYTLILFIDKVLFNNTQIIENKDKQINIQKLISINFKFKNG